MYFHEEQRFSWWIAVVVGLVTIPAILTVVPLATRRPEAIGAILLGPIVVTFVLGLLALAKLVVDVDDRGIHVSFHYLWPTRHIALADVRRAHATTYNSLVDYGGWGVRLSLKGWAFNTGGGEGVLVETRSGDRVMIGSRRAGELASAIARAVADRRDG